MTRYVVDVTVGHMVAGGELRAWLTVSRATLVEASGACLTPIEVRAGGHATVIACARRLPADLQCNHCRHERTVVARRHVLLYPDPEAGRIVPGAA